MTTPLISPYKSWILQRRKVFVTWFIALIAMYIGLMGSTGFFSEFDSLGDGLWHPLRSISHWKTTTRLEVPNSFEDIAVSNRTQELDNKREKTRYLFILDISGSILGEIKKPDWYDDDIKNLIEGPDPYLQSDADVVKKGASDVEILEAAMIRMFKLMRELELAKRNNHHESHFAVWTVGDKGEKLFPRLGHEDPNYREDLIQVNRVAIYDAILEIQKKVEEVKEETKGKLEDDTDFKDLFKKINDVYGRDNSSLVITILSDFDDDPPGEETGNEEEDLDAFFEDIEDFFSREMLLNAVVLKKAEADVIQVLKEGVEWYRMRERYIGDEMEKRILFPFRTYIRKVHYYYEEENQVVNYVDFVFGDRVDTKITIPDSVLISRGWRSQSKLRFKWSILAPKAGIISGSGNEIESSRLSINDPFEKHVNAEHSLRLAYDPGRMLPLPEGGEVQIRVFFDDYWRGYLMGIRFKKLMPPWLALIALALMTIFVILASALIWGHLPPLRRGTHGGKQSQGSPIAGGSNVSNLTDQSCRVLLFGLNRSGKTTLINALLSTGGMNYEPPTPTFHVRSGTVTSAAENKKVHLVIADYRGDKQQQIFEQLTNWQNSTFFEPGTEPRIDIVIFLVDLFPLKEDSAQYKSSDSTLIELYKQGAAKRILDRVRENQAYVTKHTIDQILDFAAPSGHLLCVKLLINKVDLLEKIVAKGYVDLKGRSVEDYATWRYDQTTREVRTRCEEIDPDLGFSTHVVSVVRKQGTGEIVDLIAKMFPPGT